MSFSAEITSDDLQKLLDSDEPLVYIIPSLLHLKYLDRLDDASSIIFLALTPSLWELFGFAINVFVTFINSSIFS